MLQLVTKQGCKSLPVKVDPGTDVNTIPLSHYKTLFPNHFTKDGHLKQTTLRTIASTWSPYDGHTQHFMGYFTIDVQHKTSPQIIPFSFCVFENSTRPFTLLSYSTSIHLGIMEFKVPNEVSSHAMVHSITNNPDTKQVSFSNPLHYSNTAKKSPTKKSPKKSLLKCQHTRYKAFQDHNSALQDHDAPKVTPLHNSTNE